MKSFPLKQILGGHNSGIPGPASLVLLVLGYAAQHAVSGMVQEIVVTNAGACPLRLLEQK